MLQAACALALGRTLVAKAHADAVQPDPRPRLQADPFALGVASGDPHRTGFTLWTRLIGADLISLEAPMRVTWEIAEDDGFRRIVRAGAVIAAAGSGHSLHIDIDGLRPGRVYFYRFQAGGARSTTGHARTLPREAARFRIALTSCQHWEHGHFNAYADMCAHEPDIVVQLGDYIYEKSFGVGPDIRRFPLGDPHDLYGYRARHALYKTEPFLCEAHRLTTWIASPDDHEVENDYAGAVGGVTRDPADFMRRRTAAYQAYLEHMPLSLARRWQGGSARFYGSMDIGNLVRLYLLDTRQHRALQPCAPIGQAQGALTPRTCSDLESPSRSILGAAQEAWATSSFRNAQPIWTVIAQQTLFSPLELAQAPESMIWSDAWDGYPHSRRVFMDALASGSAKNTLILGGDVHSFWHNEIAHAGRRVGHEIVTSCLASRNAPQALFQDVQARNPHVRFTDNRHAGYVLIELAPRSALIDYRAVDSLTVQGARSRSLHMTEIAARE